MTCNRSPLGRAVWALARGFNGVQSRHLILKQHAPSELTLWALSDTRPRLVESSSLLIPSIAARTKRVEVGQKIWRKSSETLNETQAILFFVSFFFSQKFEEKYQNSMDWTKNDTSICYICLTTNAKSLSTTHIYVINTWMHLNQRSTAAPYAICMMLMMMATVDRNAKNMAIHVATAILLTLD